MRKSEEPADVLALERQLCFALSLASRAVIAAYRPVLEPLRLTHPQYLVMLALWSESPLSLTRLSQLLNLEPATLSPLLKRLEAADYITRERDLKDERALAVRLTHVGRALRTQAEQIPAQMMNRFDMTLSEATALHASMMKLIVAATTEHHND